MINGAHVVLYSRDADADRRLLRDVLGFPHVDAGHGWLIFALPPSEVAVHPAEDDASADFYLMCDDLTAERARLHEQGVATEDVTEARWGALTRFSLPGGGTIGLYEPRHPRPHD